MPRQATPRARAKAHTPETARQTLSSVFVQAMQACRMSQGAAARVMRVTPRTVGNYARGLAPLKVESVMLSSRLWRHFLRCLRVTEGRAHRV